jgi:uncharacterized protein involved in response to NO
LFQLTLGAMGARMLKNITRAAFNHEGVTEDVNLILIQLTIALGVTVDAWLAAYVIRSVCLT